VDLLRGTKVSFLSLLAGVKVLGNGEGIKIRKSDWNKIEIFSN